MPIALDCMQRVCRFHLPDRMRAPLAFLSSTSLHKGLHGGDIEMSDSISRDCSAWKGWVSEGLFSSFLHPPGWEGLEELVSQDSNWKEECSVLSQIHAKGKESCHTGCNHENGSHPHLLCGIGPLSMDQPRTPRTCTSFVHLEFWNVKRKRYQYTPGPVASAYIKGCGWGVTHFG